MSNLSISAQIELRKNQNELMELSNRPTLTAVEKRRFDSLLTSISLLKSGVISDEVRFAEANQLAREFGFGQVETTAEGRKREADRAMMRSILAGPSGEYRTYSPLASAGNPYVPQGFEKILLEAQMSAGPLFAGSDLISNIFVTEGNPSKLPTMDDLSSTGFVVDENTAETDGVFSPKSVMLTLQRFSSGLTQYSLELAQDVEGFEGLTQVLGTALGRRLSRIQNSTFLAALLTTLDSNSSASISSETSSLITDTDCRDLIGTVNAAYRQSSKAAFLMNSGTQLMLSKLKSTGGLPILPKVMAAQPSILGFPVYISDFCDEVATGNKPIIFGDWSNVFIRSIQGFNIRTLNERFVDIGAFAVLARKRAAMAYAIQSTSDSALKYITVS